MTDNSEQTYIDQRVTALLTEHFGFPPIVLIDEVINAVNAIMYTCLKAMEEFLRKTQKELRGLESDDEENKDPDEIDIGTAKLETLLESHVDNNFDKFELYTLRNIFTVPRDLVEEGWIKLKHHEGIDFNHNSEEKATMDQEIAQLTRNIKYEICLRKILILQVTKAKKVIKTLKLFQHSIRFLGNKVVGENNDEQLSLQARLALKSLSPLDETLFFLLKQVDDLIKQTHKISTKFSNNGQMSWKFEPDFRDRYLDRNSVRILRKIGIIDTTEDDEMDIDKNGLEANFLPEVEISDLKTVQDMVKTLDSEDGIAVDN